MSYNATKPGLALSVVYLSMVYIILLFIRAPFYVSLVFVAMCSVLVVLAKLSVLAKWLARKTPLRKPNRGEWIVSRKSRLKSVYYFLGLLYCFIVLLCVLCCLPSLCDIFPTTMARCSLFVLKVPLNTKQTNNWRAPLKNWTSRYIYFFHLSLNGVLFLMFCLLVEGKFQVLIKY